MGDGNQPKIDTNQLYKRDNVWYNFHNQLFSGFTKPESANHAANWFYLLFNDKNW